MNEYKALIIRRAPKFSPNSVEKDCAIIEAVADILSSSGISVRMTDEDLLTSDDMVNIDMVLTMCRSRRALDILTPFEDKVAMINVPSSIMACNRKDIRKVMRRNNLPYPTPGKIYGNSAVWIKRADGHTMVEHDVVFCESGADKTAAVRYFKSIGSEYITQAHVEGDLVKFYGVGSDFFRTFYPGDDGDVKYTKDLCQDKPRHYAYGSESLREAAETIAREIGIDVWGGDAIITPDGDYYIIDFNDWPSFSRCRDDAAKAIAQRIILRITGMYLLRNKEIKERSNGR